VRSNKLPLIIGGALIAFCLLSSIVAAFVVVLLR
jgi:hypothetical protein